MLVAAAGYALFALWVFRPTPTTLAHTVPAFHGRSGDVLLLIWATSWVSQALFTDPLHLFDAGIYYPARDTLAFGDHMIGEALLGLPVWLTTGNPLLEYNLLSLAAFVLCAVAMLRYRRATGGGIAGAVAAGLAFSFTPFRLQLPTWLQLLVTFAMPLAVGAWLRFVRDGRRRDFALWIFWWVVHSLMGMYVAFYFALVMGGLAVAGIVLAPTSDRRRLAIATLAAPLVAGLLLAPTLWPYVVLRMTQGHVRTLGMGTPWIFFLPGPGTWSGALFGFGHPVNGAVLSFGPGLLTSLAALAGVVVARVRARDPWTRFVWAVNAVGLILALGLMLIPIELQLRLPGFDMVRITYRALHVGLVFVAWFVGATVDAVVGMAKRPALRVAVAACLVAALALDVGTPPTERRRLPIADDQPPIYQAVRRMPEPVLYERTNGIEGSALAMYHAIFHRKRLVNGYSGFTSPGPAFVTHRLFEFPSDDARALLSELDVHAVLLREADGATLDRKLAALGPSGAEVVHRDGPTALVRVPSVPPRTSPPAIVLPRAGWRLTASDAEGALPAVVDGDAASVWRVVAERPRIPWLMIDLGRVAPVAGLRAVSGAPDAPGLYLADIETSLDGDSWTATSARFDPESLQMLFQRPSEMRRWEARFAPRDARFVRLTNPRLAFWGAAWEIAELDVLTPAAGSAP